MRLENIFVVLKREYLSRVKNKGFWIATLAVPLFASAVTILPTLLISKSHTSQTIVVVDATGRGAGDALKAQMAKPKEKAATTSRRPGKGESRLADFIIAPQMPAAD